MDNPSLYHSDSDSGESWTLLDHNSGLAEDAPNVINTIESENEKPEIHEKDEDTDGISIISDSDPESSSPCQMHYETLDEEDQDLQHLSQCPFNLAVPDEQSNKDDADFLNFDHGKHRTYVHKRNKRLSTVLNIIVLGSVITAAGVAIGHMWGAKSDRSINTIPNVNNILSNLYKLQEENAYLRNKVKELTAINSQQISQFKGSKHNRCKKVFEESLNSDNIEKAVKCVDDKVDFSGILHNGDNKMSEPVNENDFKENINTLKNIYLENKNWLDNEIVSRLQQENQYQKRIKKNHATKLQKINEEKDVKVISENKKTIDQEMVSSGEQDVKLVTPKIISYADSLKTNNEMQKEREIKIKNNTTPYNTNKRNKHGKTLESGFESPISEAEIVKDSRYVSPKFKQERKKNDRPKSYKKQKRRNKYEQWEMKGGFLKDYDDISISQDPNNISNDPNLQEKIEKRCIVINKKSRNKDYITQNCNIQIENKQTQKHKSNQDQELNLSNSKSMYRADMKRLEEGLFGGEANPAGWYFRRMHKREQCRAKANNTNQKYVKRNMNYKMKH